jgi:hypothetical protein
LKPSDESESMARGRVRCPDQAGCSATTHRDAQGALLGVIAKPQVTAMIITKLSGIAPRLGLVDVEVRVLILLHEGLVVFLSQFTRMVWSS